MDREKAIQILKRCEAESHCKHYKRHYCCIGCGQREALDLAIEALKQTEIVRCKDCKHYTPPHIKYNDGTRKDYPDGLVTVDIGMNVGGKCENSTTTMRTYCTAHDRENPDDFEELVIFRQPMEYCSFGEKAEKHQLSGETSTNTSTNEGDAESATTTDCNYTCSDCKHQDKAYEQEPCYSCFNNDGAGYEPDTDCISRQQAIEALTGWETEPLDEDIVRTLNNLPPVTPTERTGEWIEHDPKTKGLAKIYECPFCGDEVIGEKTNFCPNCGADMRGDKE